MEDGYGGGIFDWFCGVVVVCVACGRGGLLSFWLGVGVSGCLVGGACWCFVVVSVLLLSVVVVGVAWGLVSFGVAVFFWV